MNEARNTSKRFKATIFAANIIQNLAISLKEVTGSILDLGTGLGVLAFHMANQGALNIIGSDIDIPTIINAKEESRKLNLPVHFVVGDLFSPFRTQFDLIVANPPLFPEHLTSNRPPAVRFAFTGGQTGIEFIWKILQQAPDYLKPTGRLVITVPKLWRNELDPGTNMICKTLTTFEVPCRDYKKVLASYGFDSTKMLEEFAFNPGRSGDWEDTAKEWAVKGTLVIDIMEYKPRL